jgi:exopolyphosphatase/guanosine-5'-triphosphate,3'-diphosphate pyrophosphatase
MVDLDPSSPITAVLQLAQTCEYDAAHTHQVTRLALRLYDELQTLHNLGEKEREWLHFASLLHDIGWIEGWKEHHKVALRIILTTPLLPFSNKDRLVIGSIARYHRKALPDIKHDHYAALSPDERHVVDLLASILRLADGLDSSHQTRVRDLTCKISPKKIIVKCAIKSGTKQEIKAALERSDLIKQVLHRDIEIKWEEIS